MSETWSYRDKTWSERDDVVGYDVHAVDGGIGTVAEATSDTDRAHIVVDTGFWIFGKKRMIPAGAVTKVDHDARTLTVSLSKDQIKAAPDYGDDPDDAHERHTEFHGPFATD
jgi:hypothetical protein